MGFKRCAERIPFPDMRIEYDTPDGERARVDIELVASITEDSISWKKSAPDFQSTPMTAMCRTSGAFWINVN
jgi:hypothetical protein